MFMANTSKKKCTSEPDIPYEESVCGFAEKVGVKVCDTLKNVFGDRVTECRTIIMDIAEGRLNGEKAREIFVERFGEEAYRRFSDSVKETIVELTGKG
jgi:hypothetical protein